MKNQTNQAKIIVLINIVIFVFYYLLSVYFTQAKYVHDYRFLQRAIYLAIGLSLHSFGLIFLIIFNFVKKNNEVAKLFIFIQLVLLLIGFPFCVYRI